MSFQPNPSSLAANARVSNNTSGAGLSRGLQAQWLERSRYWKGLSNDWRPRRVLGSGSFGLVGLWEYHGMDPKFPKYMVVKQSADQGKRSLKWESKFLRAITGTGTKHVPKIYKAYHEGHGTGVSENIDPAPFNEQVYAPERMVSRIYLEFCPGGDLYELGKDLLLDRSYDEQGKPLPVPSKIYLIPEEYLWRILNCIAKGLLVLQTGTEDPKAPLNPLWGQPIAHFDLKPPNILVGEKDDLEHKRFEPLKISDFGISMRLPPSGHRRSTPWLRASKWRITPGFKPPEMLHKNHPNVIVSTTADIWSIGAIMVETMTGRVPALQVVATIDGPDGGKIIAGGTEIRNPARFPYSQRLVNLICWCLAYDPEQRVSAKYIVEATQEILDRYDMLYANTNRSVESLTLRGPIILPPGENAQTITLDKKYIAGGALAPPLVPLSPFLAADQNPVPLLFPDHSPEKPISRENYMFS